MTELSPATQALVVMDAFLNGYIPSRGSGVAFQADRNGIAAALRAAADQVAPEEDVDEAYYNCLHSKWDAQGKQEVRRDLLAIAAELEGHHA